MKTRCLPFFLAAVLTALTLASDSARAQDTNTNALSPEKLAQLIASKLTNRFEIQIRSNEVTVTGFKQKSHRARASIEDEVRVGSDFTLGDGVKAGGVVVVFGKVRIDGTVEGDLVNVFGGATFGSNAVVTGDTIVVAGPVNVASTNTSLKGDLVVVGGTLDAPPEFKPGGELVHPPLGYLLSKLGWLLDWFKGALLWGRPIAPGVGWVWAVAGIFFVVHLLLNLLFDRPLRSCTGKLVEKPFTALLVGMLVLMLCGPVFILLAATGVGLIIVPFLLFALLLAAVFGKIAVARWIGGSVVRHGTEEERFAPVRSFVIGTLVIYVLYMIPIVGLAVWAMTRLIGLGAATMAFIQAFKKENPAPAPIASPSPAPAVGTGIAPAAAEPTAPPAVPGDVASLPRAGFSRRLLAVFLDVVLVTMICGSLGVFNHGGPGLPMFAVLAYAVAFWVWRGTTIGGIICNLRVVRVDGQRLRLGDAVVRGLAAVFSVMIFFLGFLWMIWDPEKQTWHDKIAGTYVVRVPRSSPLL